DLGALDSDLARAMSDRSLEPTGVVSGKERELEKILAVASPYRYESVYDGQTYDTYRGYGHDTGEGVAPNMRGSAGNDHIFVTSFKLTYILTGSFQRAKFR